MVLDGRLEKTAFYAFRIELQKGDSISVYSFIQIFDVANIHDVADYIDSLKTLNAQFPEPEPENEPGLFTFVSMYQIHSIQKYVKNIQK